jgi:L-lactate dehydrogenase complex protein LldE
MDVDIFIPCYIDQLFPDAAWSMVKILEKLHCKVHYNPEQTCCGQPAWTAGKKELTKPVAEKWMKDFSSGNYVVCPAGSCVGMVRNYYHEMFMNSSYHLTLRAVQAKTFELSEFLLNIIEKDELGARLQGKAVFHDACSALRECKIKEGPRRLLANVAGLELIEVPDAETCCGFGGAFSVKYEAISTAMAEQKVNNAIALGADFIISTDLSCLMHLEGYIRKKKLPIKTMHLAEVLASGWE